MHTTNWPEFVLTSDVEWSHDACIEDLVEIAERFSIKPVLFATHESRAIHQYSQDERIELGLHPNFLPGSTHGTDVEGVVDHVLDLYPKATSFRSHSFVDSAHITRAFWERGIRYDSNLCLHLQHGLTPLRHQSGLLRFPVFWEDDEHWTQTGGDWSVSELLDAFLTPGLKIINVHPLHVFLNTPDGDTYASVKEEAYESLEADKLRDLRHEGAGTRTFLIELLERLTEMGHCFHTLAQLFNVFADQSKLKTVAAVPGRENPVTDEDYQRYWSSDNEIRQKMLRDLYEARDPLDSYATSRDFNLRELEIAAIKRWLGSGRRVLDLGCGNAYTLLSIGKEVAGRELVGVDFSDNLVGGALALIEEALGELESVPRVLCRDAWAHLADTPDASVDCVITERFLLNLPDWQSQKDMLREIERVLAPGGRVLMCEGSQDGFQRLNDVREACGLPGIPETSIDNLGSNRFVDEEIENFVTKDIGLQLCAKEGVSEYFLISRVLHPLVVAPTKPRFDARINELARRIQLALPFQPHLGTNVLWVLEKPDLETGDHA